jgi:hypothetical protein
MIKGDLYCKNCYLRIFHEKGQYSSFGEKTLPKAEAGKAIEHPSAPVNASSAAPASAAPAAAAGGAPAAVSTEATVKPSDAVRKASVAPGTVPPGQKACYVCSKVAYDMESITYDKMVFHKTCFKCLSCK